MGPIKFKHCNIEAGKGQEEYNVLPALKLDTDYGEVISCWKMTFWERLKVLITGKIWMVLLTFNKPITPSKLVVNRKDAYLIETDKEYQKVLNNG